MTTTDAPLSSQSTATEDHTTAWTLTGFGDEVDPDPAIQCAVLAALGASHVEVRSAWNTNIVELPEADLHALADTISVAGLGTSAIASPIGKSEISEPASYELDRLDHALRAAEVLDARFIRIFSYWCRTPETAATIHAEVIDRLGALTERAAAHGVTLVHENEKEIYGDTPERVLDIINGVGSPALRVAWDNANFVQVGVRPFTDGFALLAPYIAYFQVKDARATDGTVVPAGHGDGELAETIRGLRDADFRGFASLEPHLTDQNELGGFTGPAGYGRAARAFRTLTDQAGITLV